MSDIEATSSKIDIEKFDGTMDFGMWKEKMLMQLELQDLEPVMVEEGKEDADSDIDIVERGSKKWRKMDKRARNLICTSLVNRVLRKVIKEKTALGVWKALERDYQQKSLPNRIYLKQKFASYKMSEDKSIEENMDDFLKLISDLASLEIEISDEDQAIQILSSLPKQYDSLVDTLKYGNKKETLTIEDVVNSAYSKETELREKGLLGKGNVSGEMLYVENRGRSDNRDSDSSSKKKGRSKSRGKNSSKSGCYVCGKEGHWKRDCPERKKETNSANVVEPRQPIALTVSIQDSETEWVMDSGCSFHITPNRSVLYDFKEFDGGKVLMANNTHSEIKGMGKIRIENADGTVVTLSDVRYMPGLSRNLISYAMLEKSGCSYAGKDYTVNFYKDGQKVLTGKCKEGLYILEGKVCGQEVFQNIKEKEPKSDAKTFEPGKRRVTFKEGLIQGPTPSGEPSNHSIGSGGASDEGSGGVSGLNLDGNHDANLGGEEISESVGEKASESVAENMADSEIEGKPSDSEEKQDLEDYVLTRDRVRRQIKKPSRFDEDEDVAAYALSTAEEQNLDEPRCFQEAMRSNKSKSGKSLPAVKRVLRYLKRATGRGLRRIWCDPVNIA